MQNNNTFPMGLFDSLRPKIGIDPGSQNLRLMHNGELFFDEPCKISIDRNANKESGIGLNINLSHFVLSPVDYVIGDFQGFELLLRRALKTFPQKTIIPPAFKAFFVIPTCLTEVEKRAYRDSAEHAGSLEVYMLFSSCAAALGMNILHEKKHFVLIEFSASKVEITVIGNGLIVSDGCVRMGTKKIFSILKNHFFRKYKISLDDHDLEKALRSFEMENIQQVKLQHVLISRAEFTEILCSYFMIVNDMILETIERAGNHEAIGMIMSNGAYFTGGGSSIAYLRKQIDLKNIQTTVSNSPAYDCINGLKIAMNNVEQYKGYLMT